MDPITSHHGTLCLFWFFFLSPEPEPGIEINVDLIFQQIFIKCFWTRMSRFEAWSICAFGNEMCVYFQNRSSTPCSYVLWYYANNILFCKHYAYVHRPTDTHTNTKTEFSHREQQIVMISPDISHDDDGGGVGVGDDGVDGNEGAVINLIVNR